MLPDRNFFQACRLRILSFALLALFLAATSASASTICYELEGVLGVSWDPQGILADLDISNLTPVLGILSYDADLAVGSIEWLAGEATFSADTRLISDNEVLFHLSDEWDFPTSFASTYGDIRFEGPAGWLDEQKIPATLEESSYGWGYFSFNGPGVSVEFYIQLSSFSETSCGSS